MAEFRSRPPGSFRSRFNCKNLARKWFSLRFNCNRHQDTVVERSLAGGPKNLNLLHYLFNL